MSVSKRTQREMKIQAAEALKQENIAKAKEYALHCANQYKKDRAKYDAWFMKILEEIEILQPNAFAGVQVSRYFTMGVRKKYCVIKDPLTAKERERVERLLEN